MANEKGIEFDFEANDGFEKLADDLDEYDWIWINMGDDRVCPDCGRWAALDPAPFSEWIQNRAEPGRGESYCGDSCRCLLAPANLIKTAPDLLEGGKITIKDPGEYFPDPSTSYEIFDELDAEILKYKKANGGAKLPDEFFRIQDAQGRIDFLKGSLPPVGGQEPPKPQEPEAPIELGPEITQKQIDAEAKANFEAAKAELAKLKSHPELEKWANKNARIKNFENMKSINADGVKAVVGRLSELSKEFNMIEDITLNGKGAGSLYARANYLEMQFNRKWFNDIENFNDALKKDVAAGCHPRRTASAKAVIDHEFGHVLTFKTLHSPMISEFTTEIRSIRSAYIKEFGAATKEIRESISKLCNEKRKAYGELLKKMKDSAVDYSKDRLEYNSYADKITKEINELKMKEKQVDIFISDYANKNIYEFTAEAFSEYLNNPQAGKYSKMVGELIRKYYGKGGS